MWYLRVTARAFPALLLSLVLFILLGPNGYTHEYLAFFIETLREKPDLEIFLVLLVCIIYLFVLAFALTTTVASVVAEAHDVKTRWRLRYLFMLSFATGALPLAGVLLTLNVVINKYLRAELDAVQVSLFWCLGILGTLILLALGTILSSVYIRDRASLLQLYRSRVFFISLSIPIVLAFASVYLGAFVDAHSDYFVKHYPSLAKSVDLLSLSTRFGFVTYLIAFATMLVLLARSLAGLGREVLNTVVVILIVCAVLASWLKPSGAYPIQTFLSEATRRFLVEHKAAARSVDYRRSYGDMQTRRDAARKDPKTTVEAKTTEQLEIDAKTIKAFNDDLGIDKILKARGIKTLPEAFSEWINRRLKYRPPGPKRLEFPVFIVAAEGGGFYAAYHSALALARLQDLCPSFRNHVFALSGVSGGALGVSIFAGVSDHDLSFDWAPCKKPKRRKYEDAVRNFFKEDLLSPLLTTFLYIDLPTTLLPITWGHYDRSSALESAFERAFDRAKAQSWDNSTNSLASLFLSHWDPTLPTPGLVLNGTLVWQSKPFLLSQFYFSGKTTEQALDRLWASQEREKLETKFGSLEKVDPIRMRALNIEIERRNKEERGRRIAAGELFDGYNLLEFMPDVDLKTSTAVAISSRAPYVTPSATLKANKDLATELQMKLGNNKIQIVDGGYWDNSGIQTALDIVNELKATQTNEDKESTAPVNVHFYILSFNDISDNPFGDEEVDLGPEQANGVSEPLVPLRTMIEVRQRAQRAGSLDVSRAGMKPINLRLFDVGFREALLSWSAPNLIRQDIEKRSGLTGLTYKETENVPNLEPLKRIRSVVDATWTPEGSSEDCNLDNLDGDGWNPQRGIDGCGSLIQQNGDDTDALMNRAAFYRHLHHYKDAIDDYKRLIDLDSSDPYAYGRLGIVYVDVGDYDKAVEAFSEMIKLDPTNSAAYENRGIASDYKKDYERAIADYDKAIELDPKYTAAYTNRGNAYLDKKDYDRAIADFDKAIEYEPKYTAAYTNRGNAYLNKKDYDQAIADYDKAIELDPKDAATYYNRGLVHHDKNEDDRAIADYDKAIELDPKDASNYNSRGNAFESKKDNDRAIADYDKAIELDPKYAPAYYNRGLLHHEKNEDDKAIADYDKAIELDPKDAATYSGRGNAFKSKKDNDRAIADYDKAIELDPKDAATYNGRGGAYYDKKDYDRAIADYDKAIELDPKYAPAYYNRGLVHHDKNEDDKAIADYDNAIELDPKDASNYNSRGNAFKSKKDNDRAIADYDKAIELDPKYAPAYSNRAIAHEDRKEYNRALADAEIARELVEDDETTRQGRPGSETADALGSVTFSALLAGSFDKALDASNRALALVPDLLWVKMNRAHALMFTGRTADAKQIYFAYKGQRIPENDNKPWEVVVIEDFAQFRKTGLHGFAESDMAEIEAELGVQSR